MERIQAEQSRESRHLDDASKHAEQFLARRTILQQKKTECTDKIRGIGALPDDAFEKYLQTSSKRLVKDLHKVNESLKKYSHVNKKAYEQYNNFTKQRDSLQERKKELDASAKVSPHGFICALLVAVQITRSFLLVQAIQELIQGRGALL